MLDKGSGALSKYANTYATTAISQYAGENNKILTDDLGLEWFEYVGSNIETTREFCDHLTEKRYIHKSEIKTILKGEIDGYQCEIYEKTGLPKGMIEGTNEQNFQVNCGGWNCRHQLVPVAKEAIPKNEKEALPYRNNPDYTDVKTNKQGGMKATHVGHIDHTNEKNIFMGLNPTQLEEACQNQLFRMGHSAVFCDESIQTKKGQNDTSLDLLLDGKRMDIASVTKDVDDYRNILWGKNSQLKRFNELDYVKVKANSVCLYFNDPQMYNQKKVIKGIEKLKNTTYTIKSTNETKNVDVIIKYVYCVIRGDNKLKVFKF